MQTNLLQQSIFPQLVTKFYGTQKILQYSEGTLLAPLLSQMNAVHGILAYSFQIYISIINIYSWTSQVHPPAHSVLKIK